MPNELIRPNWHVILIHYPLGLLAIGLLIEVFSFLWRRSTFRTAGRWMVLLGALLSVPALTTGLYAFRDVVAPGVAEPGDAWHEVVRQSPWSQEQWGLMRRHVLYASTGVGLSVLAVFVWLAVSDASRRRMHWPLVVVALAGLGALTVGAWYSGEAVYRHGTAVERPGYDRPESESRHDRGQAASDRGGAAFDVEAVVPPMQLHVLLAGLTVAAAVAALGLSVHWWNRERRFKVDELAEHLAAVGPPVTDAEGRPVVDEPEAVALVGTSASMPFPARYWLVTLVLGAGAFASGLWQSNDWQFQSWSPDGWRDEPRLAWHLTGGAAIAVTVLLLTLLTRFFRRWRAIGYLVGLLLVVLVAAQAWLGIAMLYDSTVGPLVGYQDASDMSSDVSPVTAPAGVPATTRPAP